MSKKILILSLAYYPKHVGGAEVAIKEITDRIIPSQYEFHMVTLRFDSTLPRTEQVGNILVHRIGFSKENPTPKELKQFPLHLNKFLYQILAYRKACSLHRMHHYDGVWGMMAHATAVPFALFSLSHPSVPRALSLQEGDDLASIEARARVVWPLFTRAFRQATLVQVISTYLGDWARKMGATGRVVHIPNGVDRAVFTKTQTSEQREIARKSLGVGSNDVLLVSTSRLVKKNGLEDIISALSHLPAHVHLLLVGEGPLEAGLRAHVAKLGLVGRVLFLGKLPYEEIPRYLSLSDVFVRPSRSEGMGNSFIEAMAVGLPVIATREGGLRDFIFDEKYTPDTPMTAWAVPKDDPKMIAEAVLDIIARPEKVREVVENANAFISGKYEWSRIASRMKEEVFTVITR